MACCAPLTSTWGASGREIFSGAGCRIESLYPDCGRLGSDDSEVSTRKLSLKQHHCNGRIGASAASVSPQIIGPLICCPAGYKGCNHSNSLTGRNPECDQVTVPRWRDTQGHCFPSTPSAVRPGRSWSLPEAV